MIIPLIESSQVAEARRQAAAAAHSAGFGEEDCGRAALVATELATNLLKHGLGAQGEGGEIVVGRFDDADGVGVEILALDRGRGMADVQQCLRDGYSTGGSAGTGLGAVARLSDQFNLFSRPGQGTAVMARLAPKGRGPAGGRRGPQIGAVAAVCPGETISGDAWAVDTAHGETLLVADGSGHGPLAATAARAAIETFRAQADKPLPRLLEAIHRALSPTRGAAVAAARVDRGAGVVRYTGIGNIAGMLVNGGQGRHMVSHNGTAGHVAPRIAEFTYPYAGAPMLILTSDGLTTRWDLAAYPGLAQAHPGIVAGVLYRDHRRGRDDATVVVLKAAA